MVISYLWVNWLKFFSSGGLALKEWSFPFRRRELGITALAEQPLAGRVRSRGRRLGRRLCGLGKELHGEEKSGLNQKGFYRLWGPEMRRWIQFGFAV